MSTPVQHAKCKVCGRLATVHVSVVVVKARPLSDEAAYAINNWQNMSLDELSKAFEGMSSVEEVHYCEGHAPSPPSSDREIT